MPPLDAILEYEVVDNKTGRVISKGRQRVRSWLKFWMQWMYILANVNDSTDPPTISAVDTGGTSRTIPYYAMQNYFRRIVPGLKAIAGDSGRGLVVGSGSSPNTVDTYKLESLIPHGTSTGQLQYGETSVSGPTQVSPEVLEVQYYRSFTNGSGGDVVIRECGIYASMFDYAGSVRYFCAARDLINPPSGVTVPDGSTLIIRYRFRITLS